MKLLLINYEFPPVGGGASNATWFMGRELVRSGHYVCVLTSAFGELPGLTEEEGVRVYRVRSLRKDKDHSNVLEMGSFVLYATLAVSKLAVSEDIEGCIVFFSLPTGPVALVLKKQRGIPYIVSLRGGDVPGLDAEVARLHKVLAPLRRSVLRNAEAVVANSPALAETSMRADPIAAQIIPNGVDVDYYTPPLLGPQVGRDFRLLFVGRFRNQKNLRLVLDAVKQLAGRTSQEIVLDIVGDGPLRDEMHQYAGEIGISDRTFWHGWVSKERLRNLYQKADCFVNPSLYEGMPNTVLEAMACGLPVVASDIVGNQDLIIHGETGFLFTLGNDADFFEAIQMLIAGPEQAVRMGALGRARVVNEFSWVQVARRYVQLFRTSVKE